MGGRKPYDTCPECGSHLDWGEPCDCKNQDARQEERDSLQSRLNRMTSGDAFIIFQNINSDTISDMEKALAIKKISDLATHMGVTKKMMLEAIRWLLGQAFEIDETQVWRRLP